MPLYSISCWTEIHEIKNKDHKHLGSKIFFPLEGILHRLNYAEFNPFS